MEEDKKGKEVSQELSDDEEDERESETGGEEDAPSRSENRQNGKTPSGGVAGDEESDDEEEEKREDGKANGQGSSRATGVGEDVKESKLKQWLRVLRAPQQLFRRKPRPVDIQINDHAANKAKRYPKNHFSTAKVVLPNGWVDFMQYTWWSFLPKTVYEQFRKVSNCYFLLVIVIQFIPGMSPFIPVASVIPLAFVILISALRELVEDIFRHIEDRKNNRIPYRMLRDPTEGWREARSQDLTAGDIVKVNDGQQIPADMIAISSSHPKGSCYITTANLDGETNLKLRNALDTTAQIGSDEEKLMKLRGRIEAEAPNEHIYHFIGRFMLPGADTKKTSIGDELEMEDLKAASKGERKVFPLGNEQLLLKGSQLRNTDCVYGLVIYAGRHTKLALNLHKPPSKMSTVDYMLNYWVLLLFLVLGCLVLLLAMGSIIWDDDERESMWYVDNPYSRGVYYIRNVGTYLILLSNFVPISLWVTVELIKVGQSRFMTWDDLMRSSEGASMRVKTSTLNEDLGRIQHIFTDKTGTLTENVMEFAKCSIDGVKYVEERYELISKKRQMASSNQSERREDNLASSASSTAPHKESQRTDTEGTETELSSGISKVGALGCIGRVIQDLSREEMEEHPVYRFLQVLTLCHAVVPERDKKTDKLIYRTPSPDEKALVEAASRNGFELTVRTTDNITIVEFGETVTYELLATLDFDAARKRMSVIVRSPNTNKLYLMTKGADDAIYARLAENDLNSARMDPTSEHLRRFARTGLRTLAVAYRELNEDEYNEWRATYDEACTAIDKREEMLNATYEVIENNMTLLGCTAIEDKLQDGVPETIEFLLQAGIKIWILTGDKQETAIEIGHATNLLKRDMKLVKLNAHSEDACRGKIQRKLIKYKLKTSAQIEQENQHRLEGRKQRLVWLRKWLNRRLSWFKPQHPIEPVSLVIDGETLAYALRKDTIEDFILLTSICHSVVCCRTSPLQKSMVVRSIKKGEGRICLAIGDGANDVSMIQKAHVGIGIFGKEGNQAARAADYAIHQFKHLKRLLCIHGRKNYIQTTGLVQYFFYKNICYNLPFVWYSFFNGFSAQTIYDSWVIGCFNIFFTSLPSLSYGVFERDLKDETIEKYPQLYRRIQEGKLFTPLTFFSWLGDAVWESLVVFFAVYFMFQNDVLLSDGETLDLWSYGIYVGTFLTMFINFRLFIFTNEWNWITHVVNWLTIVFYWFFMSMYALFNFTPYFTNLYYIFYMSCRAASFWFLFLGTGVVSFLPDIISKYIYHTYFPPDWVILREAEKYKDEETKSMGTWTKMWRTLSRTRPFIASS